MASLRDIRNRIGSVKNTRQITRAMKLVAGAKLARATGAATAARPYADTLSRVLQSVVRAAGGEVIGVIPQTLVAREVAHTGIDDLRVVGSMHERKALMAELADGFIALPGGIGTLEELFEVWTWAHLGLHRKPCALLDVDGFYVGLSGFLDHVDREGFLREGVRGMLLIDDDARRLIGRLRDYRAPDTPQVLTRATT